MSDLASRKRPEQIAIGFLLVAALILVSASVSLLIFASANTTLYVSMLLILLFTSLVLLNFFLDLISLTLGKKMLFPLGMNRYLIGILTGIAGGLAKAAGLQEQFTGSYIYFDALLVRVKKLKLKPEEILVLLPRCIQNNECKYNVVNNMDNCISCGKCDLKEINVAVLSTGVKAAVVTGGSQARALVKKYLPKAIIAVACERELLSGIFDVPNCDVIGLINERPEGPCVNTRASVSKLKETILNFLEGR